MPDKKPSLTANTPSPKPVPPSGYEIQNLPTFLRPANANTKIEQAEAKTDPGVGPVAANVDPSNPNTILVRAPKYFTQPIQTHESTHVYQLSRNAPFVDHVLDAGTGKSKGYDYGGLDGLEQAIKGRKTVADFNVEQQAQMVSDFQSLTADALKRQDAKALSRITAAYHPFISQLSKIPPKGADMTKMTQQDLSPAAPSLPPSTVAGMPMLPDKLIGGDVAQTQRKIGETKRFANGSVGKWDGHGWRLTQ